MINKGETDDEDYIRGKAPVCPECGGVDTHEADCEVSGEEE